MPSAGSVSEMAASSTRSKWTHAARSSMTFAKILRKETISPNECLIGSPHIVSASKAGRQHAAPQCLRGHRQVITAGNSSPVRALLRAPIPSPHKRVSAGSGTCLECVSCFRKPTTGGSMTQTRKAVERELLALEKKYWQSLKDRDSAGATRLTDDPCFVTGAQGVESLSKDAVGSMIKAAPYRLIDFKIDDDAHV